MFKWLIPERFPDGMEQDYQAELRKGLFKQVRYAVIAGMVVCFLFLILDFQDIESAPDVWKARLGLTCAVTILVWYMDKMPEHATRWLDRVTTCMGAYSALSLMIMSFLLMQGVVSHGETPEIWYLKITFSKSIEIIYVFGPLATPLLPALLICLANTVLTILLGGYFDVPPSLLIEAMMNLLGIVFMGALFRRQFEIHSRHEYLDKQELKTRRQEAENLAQERVRFIRDSSHNLRQPLQAIVAHNEALAMRLNRREPYMNILPSADCLSACVHELKDSFNKIMHLSSLYENREAVSVIPFQLAETFHKLESLYAPAAAAKGINLVVRDLKPGVWVSSDTGMLASILGNLLDNAIKYTVRGKILVRAVTTKGRVNIHIVDTGIGIGEQDREKIFKEFHRVENWLGVGGMGIGLAFVKNALERLPGHALRWSSTEGRGTHFCLSLPPATPADCPSQRNAPKPAEGIGQGKMILWVDDNLRVLDSLVQSVSLYGYEIVKAACATETGMALDDLAQFRQTPS